MHTNNIRFCYNFTHVSCSMHGTIQYNINCMHIATCIYVYTYIYVIATGYIVTAVYDYYQEFIIYIERESV